MKNLLDTHTLIWFLNGDYNLSENARKAIEHKNAINYVSIASLWEIAIKVSLNKLDLHSPFHSIAEQINFNGFQLLSITFEDTLILSSLPFHHRDPFDRIIISQSISKELTIISKDSYFNAYDVVTIW
ncbi:type II toxin-antitoxin system VapC family toxin [Arcicella lustrica]|uniref:Type II toxin-antitoxin system VapC family toxin n=1 Tax=Arcicella lustrica TaxID=2984196 RepID=A0ABU5SQA6_9BACT|nr:type II toxin-antitoxin system VapC family toxin [Arcicella sp. DC25W]MEA5429491.1 type II toxin-antitoxin system VapC family toxin [Arcicella sp. DC25W]